MIFPVILAGGSGSRLWPLSRQSRPKQFLPLLDEHSSMLQLTLQRLNGLETAAPILLCNEEHRFLVAEQLRQLEAGPADILLEPAGRNTAPAIALAALQACQSADDPVLLVLAADHAVKDEQAFQQAVISALPLARSGRLVTFGIVPTHPETGYGYIRRGQPEGEGYRVARFVEKPDSATAAEYLASGEFYWNSGMFMFRARRYLEELECYQPEVLQACRRAMEQSRADLDFIRVGAEAFAQCPDISVDYAVMEHTAEAVMVPLNAGWSDVGCWSALWEVEEKNDEGNVIHGDVLTGHTRNTYIRAESRLVATLGVEELMIVETRDALLVAHKDRVQDVKHIVDQLKAQGRSEHIDHCEVFRPWGRYECMEQRERYQVKHITVKPGARLSLQMHHHRAEHWIVVSGTAKVRRGDEEQLLSENQSVYIPLGVVHSLENPGRIPLELIEVQSGSYLGEDDIVRFEDQYGRC